MLSRWTLWRYKTGQVKTDAKLNPSTRGGKSNDERREMLKFVGAVAAQLLERGMATESGLKIYPKRFVTKTRVFYVNPDGSPSNLMTPAAWAMPDTKVWDEILASGFNPDCLALAAAVVGQLVKHVRPKSVRRPRSGLTATHTDASPRRGSSKYRDLTWKAVPTMTKETASYWRNRRKDEYEKAKHWFYWTLLKGNGFEYRSDPDEAFAQGTQQRDDLTRIIEGGTVRVNRYDRDFSKAAPHYSLKRGRHNAVRQAAALR